jgi:outer membrane protein OmpA-like peptidoglycan-associated protein
LRSLARGTARLDADCSAGTAREDDVSHLSRVLLSISLIVLAGIPASGTAQDAQTDLRKRFGMRVTGAVAFFLSEDQVDWLGFRRPGFLGDLSFGMLLRSWLSAEVGGTLGMFMSGATAKELEELTPVVAAPGGLLAPWLGARVHGATRRLVPFCSLNVGPGFTGDLVRPLLQGSVGADINVGLGVSIGPVVGYSHMFQKSAPGASTDARFLWVGLTFAYRALPYTPPERTVHTHSTQRVVEVRTVVEHEQQTVYVAPPAPAVDNKELSELLDRALPAPRGRVELLAPVLFAFDSDALQPLGVAMLHEVADTLRQRSDIELVAIQGYADKRGSTDHNRELAQRRARRVMAWLTAHGIAAERLMVSEWENGYVEQGESEAEHAQNRRVIFRVLRAAEPP